MKAMKKTNLLTKIAKKLIPKTKAKEWTKLNNNSWTMTMAMNLIGIKIYMMEIMMIEILVKRFMLYNFYPTFI
jgi:hypothetical protein